MYTSKNPSNAFVLAFKAKRTETQPGALREQKASKGSASGSGTVSLFRMDHGCRLAGLVTVRQNISLVEPDEGDNQRLIRLSSEATFSPSGREESGRTPSEVIAHHRGKNGYSIWPHKPDSAGPTPAPASIMPAKRQRSELALNMAPCNNRSAL